MKKFNLANVTSFQDYKNVRFQEGMPKLTTCKIKLGEIAETTVSFEDILIHEEAEMDYSFEFKENELHEQLFITAKAYLQSYTFPIELISVCTEKEKTHFQETIASVLPFYAYGVLRYAKNKKGTYKTAEGDLFMEGMLFEYLHEELYKKGYECGYERSVTKVYNDKTSMAVWLLDSGDYVITEDVLVGHHSFSKPIDTPETNQMIQDIQEALTNYQGYYLSQEKRTVFSFDPLDNIKDILHSLLNEEEKSLELENKINQLSYQRTGINLLIDYNELSERTLENHILLVDEALAFEKQLKNWFNQYDYTTFLRRAYPEDYMEEEEGE